MKIQNIFGIAFTMLMGVAVTSCTDGNDWDVDGSFNRLFGTSGNKISVETTEENPTQATVTFSAVPDAEYYVLEVSTDSLYDEIEMGGVNAKVFEAKDNENASASTFITTLTGLEQDTKYYLRIKSMSSVKNESKWAYYKDGDSFKTKAEQIFNTIATSDRKENSIRLSWTAGAEVTKIEVCTETKQDEETILNVLKTIVLDDAAKAASEYTVDGLEASTSYTFVIYNNTMKRGTITSSTTAAMPAGDSQIELPEGTTSLTQEMIDQYADEAKAEFGSNASVTIGIPAGSTVTLVGATDAETNEEKQFELPDGISFTFFGLAGEKPKLSLKKAIEIGGKHSFLKFQDIDITTADGDGYIINQTDACVIEEVTFDGVNIDGLGQSMFRMQKEAAKNIGSLNLNNCIVNNQGFGKTGDFLRWEAKGSGATVGKVNITNCTFSNMSHNFINANSATTTEINIKDCTFYNIIGSGKYFIDIQNNNDAALNIENCIFAKTTGKGIRGGKQTITNVYFTSDFKQAGNSFKADIKKPAATSEELFEDPANLKFGVKIDDLKKLGDSRWK